MSFGLVSASAGKKILILTALVVQSTALAICTKFSYRQSAEPYLNSNVIVCSEFLKLIFSSTLLAFHEGRAGLVQALFKTRSSALQLLTPALLYVMQSNLIFEGVRQLSPTEYIVCSQSKILTSALFSVLLLKARITLKQCFALVFLVIGMIAVQLEHSESKYLIREHHKESPISNRLQGFIYVLAAALSSGFAGAYLERMFKQDTARVEHSVWHLNTQLACFSIPVAILTVILRENDSLVTKSAFQGYDFVVIFTIALHAIGGLIVAMVMRFAGNILKCFAASISICAVTFLSAFTQSDYAHISASHVVGITFVIVAIFMYNL